MNKLHELKKDKTGRYICKKCGKVGIYTQLNRKYVYHKCGTCGTEYKN